MQPVKSNADWKRILGQQLAELQRIERERKQAEERQRQQYPNTNITI